MTTAIPALRADSRLAPLWAACAGIEPWLQPLQMELTAIAAPTHFEGLRAEWMLRQFRALGLAAELDGAGNVVARRPGRQSAPGLAFTAHLDTAFPPGTPAHPQRRDGCLHAPGIADNGAGLAALLAVAKLLRDHAIDTALPLWLVANVGEEGEGDLKGMRHLFQSPLAAAWAWTVVLDGPGCEQITTQALASRRLQLVFQGPGGHSWSDAGRASAVHAALRCGAALLAQLATQPGESACGIGWVRGGSAVNAIAANAVLKVDLRATAAGELDRLERAVRRAVALGLEEENAAALDGAIQARIERLGERPAGALSPASPLLLMLRQVDAALGIAALPQCASTDANIPLSLGLEALRLGAGGKGGGFHTLREWFDPAGRGLALQRLLLLALALCGGAFPDSGLDSRP